MTVGLFRSHEPGPPIVVLGVLSDAATVSYHSGELEEELVERLYSGALLVVFPSHYEGFGLPVIHALGHRKPLVARRIPVFEEIREHCREGANIHLFDTTAEIVEFALTKPLWIEEGGEKVTWSWSDAAGVLAGALARAQDEFDFARLCRSLRRVPTLQS